MLDVQLGINNLMSFATQKKQPKMKKTTTTKTPFRPFGRPENAFPGLGKQEVLEVGIRRHPRGDAAASRRAD